MPTLQELLDRERVRTGTSGPSIISELLDTLAARQQEATVPQIIPPSLPGGGYLPGPVTPPPVGTPTPTAPVPQIIPPFMGPSPAIPWQQLLESVPPPATAPRAGIPPQTQPYIGPEMEHAYARWRGSLPEAFRERTPPYLGLAQPLTGRDVIGATLLTALAPLMIANPATILPILGFMGLSSSAMLPGKAGVPGKAVNLPFEALEELVGKAVPEKTGLPLLATLAPLAALGGAGVFARGQLATRAASRARIGAIREAILAPKEAPPGKAALEIPGRLPAQKPLWLPESVSKAARTEPRSIPLVPVVLKLGNLLRAAERVRPEHSRLLAEKRHQMAGEMQAYRERLGRGEYEPLEAFQRMRAAQRGPIEVEFEMPGTFTTEEIVDLGRIVLTSPRLRPFESANAFEALMQLLLDVDVTAGVTRGRYIAPYEKGLLAKVLGEDVIKALTKVSREPGPAQKAWRGLVDIWNLPRAVEASYDISAPLRQGAVLVGREAWYTSWEPMIRSFADERVAKGALEAIVQDPVYWAWAKPAGLAIADPGFGAAYGITIPQEAFVALRPGIVAEYIGKIPGLRHSQRSYTTFLNKLRFDTFKSTLQTWQRLGRDYSMDDVRHLARWINIASGWGELGPAEKVLPELAGVLFAPRFRASRWEMLPYALYLGLTNPLMRREVARDLAAFFTMNLSLSSLAQISGVADVELDPRSTDFGRMRIGDTRIDTWAGFQPDIRMLAQLATGAGKSTVSGEVYEKGRTETVLRRLQGILHPMAGTIVDVYMGQTFIGEQVEPTSETALRMMENRLLPMFFQDLKDAIEEYGPMGVIRALPAAAGATVLTYRTPWQERFDARDTVSQETYQMSYDEAAERYGPSATEKINKDPRVEEAQLAIDERLDWYGGRNKAFVALQEASRTYEGALTALEPRYLVNAPQANDMLREAKQNRIAARFNAEKTFPELAEDRDQYEPPNKAVSEWTGREVYDHYLWLFWDATDPETGMILPEHKESTYEQVEAFEGTLTEEQFALLQMNLGAMDTPVMSLRRSQLAGLNVKAFTIPGIPGELSYNEIPEAVWEGVVTKNKLWSEVEEATGISRPTFREFKDQVIGDNAGQGMPVGDILQRNPLTKKVTAEITKWRQKAEEKRLDLLVALLTWGIRPNARDEFLEEVQPMVLESQGQIAKLLEAAD